MPKPKWFEMYVEVNGHEPQIDHAYDTMDELVEAATDLVAGLRGEPDLGSWSVVVAPHWCDGNGECDCKRIRPEKEVASFRGETLDELEGGIK